MLQAGNRIREYRIDKHIGEGGMGLVYLATDENLDRQVAIKVLRPQLTIDEGFTLRFKNEAKAQARLNHPGIVALYSFFKQDGSYYFVMEYAPGITLDRLMLKTGLIPEKRTMPIFRQICEALNYAHKRAIVHRDVKPSNIMIDVENGDAVKIMDFGIARILDNAHITQTGTQMGTIHYMSPEQVLTPKDIDHRSDIYSAGVLLYRMLTGRLPFDADTDSIFKVQRAIVYELLPDPREVYRFISQETVDLLMLLTKKDRDDRPDDISKVFKEYEVEYEDAEPEEEDAEPEPEPQEPVETANFPTSFVFFGIVFFTILFLFTGFWIKSCVDNRPEYVLEEEVIEEEAPAEYPAEEAPWEAPYYDY